MVKSYREELIVSAYCSCFTCNVRTNKKFNEAITLEQFEKQKVNLLCQNCNRPYHSITGVTEFEAEYQDKKSNKNENNNDGRKDKDKEKEKKEFYIQKYGQGTSLIEAVIVDGLPYFLLIFPDSEEYIDGPALIPYAPLPDMILKPLDKVSYLNKEYSFESLDEINDYVERAKTETLDTLYLKVKAIWSKYIDAENDHLTMCAADTIFTYFQDKFGMTHYLLFIGDNDTGKSNNLVVLYHVAYRPLLDTSITSANIHGFLGSIEEGQGIILEDEADNIDQDIDKMKIYKVGYQTGKKVTRTDISFGRKQEGRWTYCFKAFSAEKLPNNTKAKGFMERVFVLPCSTGSPQYDIAEVIEKAGDNEYSELVNELVDVRKLLLVYRLLNYDRPIPNIKLSVKNRNRQLCKPLIRLFQNSECREEIMSALSKYLAEKRERKTDTLDSRLYEIVVNLVANTGELELSNKVIWEAVKSNIDGDNNSSKPLSYDTEEFYTISQKKVTDTLVDKFGAKKVKIGRESARGLKFDQKTLKKLEPNYAKVDEIKILSRGNADTSDTSDTSREQVSANTDTSTHANYNNNSKNNNIIDIVEHEMKEVDRRGQEIPTENADTYPYKPSEPSEPSATEMQKHTNVHRVYDGGDRWACDNCNYREDKHFFSRSICPRNK